MMLSQLVIIPLSFMAHNSLKDGNVVTYQVLQNTTTYQVRLANTPKGLWTCIEESGLNWKLTITGEMVEQTVSKASGGKQVMNLKEFSGYLLQAISKSSQKWSIGIMTPVQLQLLRGGTPSKQSNNTKIYMILSDKVNKFHYPFTFIMSDIDEKTKLIETIRTMKTQLEELRLEKTDKSQSSFSIMSETLNNGEQIRMENEEMKRKIKLYEESLTQKRGAVEIDMILKEKNTLQIKAQTKKREEQKEIVRLKNIYGLMEREINQITHEIQLINRQLLMLEDSVGTAAKIKSHAMKVLRSYESQLRTQKKILQKQVRQIENLKRNIMNAKTSEKRVLAKIKQIQNEIDQCKKKANIKEISNRLHVGNKSRGGSSADSGSSKSQSVGSSVGKPRSNYSGKAQTNLVRDNLLRKNMPASSQGRNNLLKTSPNINMSPNLVKKTSENVARPINSSHQAPKYTNNRLFNTQKYSRGSKSDNQNDSVKSQSVGKKQFTPEEKERQKRAMERLTGGKPKVPRGPSNEKPAPPPTNNRASSQKHYGSNSGYGKAPPKKDTAKQMLLKMKQIKAHYSKQANKNVAVNKNFAAKISELNPPNKQ